MVEQDVEVAGRSGRLAQSAEGLCQAATPVRVDVGTSRAEEGAAAARCDTVPADVLGRGAEANAWIVDEQCATLRLEHLAQARGAAVAADRRGWDQPLAADDAGDQPQDLGGQSQARVSRLPCFDPLTVREREAPDDSGLRREPRDRHAEAFEVAVDRVVVVHDQVLALRPEPVPGRGSADPRPGQGRSRDGGPRAGRPPDRRSQTVISPPGTGLPAGGGKSGRSSSPERRNRGRTSRAVC